MWLYVHQQSKVSAFVENIMQPAAQLLPVVASHIRPCKASHIRSCRRRGTTPINQSSRQCLVSLRIYRRLRKSIVGFCDVNIRDRQDLACVPDRDHHISCADKHYGDALLGCVTASSGRFLCSLLERAVQKSASRSTQ